jgi:CubicO group peptidase (beta-lactamase class C family)
MQRFRVPGISIAVIHDSRVHWAKGYGIADVETGAKVDVQTAFQAASISKPLTAMAAVRLAQEGKLDLDADVNSILRALQLSRDSAQWAPVTPRSLFSHSSGADDGFGFPGYNPGVPMPSPVQVIKGDSIANASGVRFVRAPYAGFKYSGGGTTIMQQALIDVTGRPFAEFMQATLLGPLGMSGSSYQQPPAPDWAPRLARAHNGAGRRMGPPWHVYPEQAAAGLWTTPSDLAKVLIEVQRAVRGPRGDVLTQDGARQVTSPVGAGPFAVGFQVEKRGEGWYFMHGGSNWGFRCDMIAHLRKGYGVVVMTNGDNGGAVIQEIEARVAAAYNWDSLHKPLIR